MKLNSHQEDFIYDKFFREEKYVGSKNIAYNLLREGKCIVAGTERIWWGGIGNFISIDDAEDAVDCSIYKFDLEEFLNSLYFNEQYQAEAQKLNTDIKVAEKTLKSLKELKRYEIKTTT